MGTSANDTTEPKTPAARAKYNNLGAVMTNTHAGNTGKSMLMPPEGAKTLELAEFAKWTNVGDAVLGCVTGYMERPDQDHPGKMMKSFLLSPAAFVPEGRMDGGAVFHSLSLGLGAHLQLLFPTPERTANESQCVLVKLEGSRPSIARGKQPSHQFKVWLLTPQQLRQYLETIAGDNDLPF